MQPDSPVTALAELCLVEGQCSIRWDVIGQVQAATPVLIVIRRPNTEEFCWPDHRVKRDIVLAHEVIDTGLRIVPPRLPCLRLATGVSPFDRGREVTNERFKPDIETFTVPAREGDRDAPVEITRDGTPLQTTLEIATGEVEDTGAPVLGVLLQIAPQGGCEGSEIEEPMLSLAQYRTTPIDPAARLQQVGRLQLGAALVALISPSVARAALRACPLYIT